MNKRVVINPGTGWRNSVEGPEDQGGYRVLGGTTVNPKGTLSEYLAIDHEKVEEAPPHLSDVEVASIPMTGLTAWRAVMVKCGQQNLGPGKNILVTGIGGGVALMALMFLKLTGTNVYVTSRDERKIAEAIKLGAKEGVNYRDSGWGKELLVMLPQGTYLDAIVDGAGGDIVNRAVKVLKVGQTTHLSAKALVIFSLN